MFFYCDFKFTLSQSGLNMLLNATLMWLHSETGPGRESCTKSFCFCLTGTFWSICSGSGYWWMQYWLLKSSSVFLLYLTICDADSQMTVWLDSRLSSVEAAHYRVLWTDWWLAQFGRHHLGPLKYCIHHHCIIMTSISFSSCLSALDVNIF